MSDLRKNVTGAVLDGRIEVQKWLEALAQELDKSAAEVRALQEYLTDTKWVRYNRTAAPVAGDLGEILRQPLGQNAQELLLRALANLAEDEGGLRILDVLREETS
jgi:hypothetical protein